MAQNNLPPQKKKKGKGERKGRKEREKGKGERKGRTEREGSSEYNFQELIFLYFGRGGLILTGALQDDIKQNIVN